MGYVGDEDYGITAVAGRESSETVRVLRVYIYGSMRGFYLAKRGD